MRRRTARSPHPARDTPTDIRRPGARILVDDRKERAFASRLIRCKTKGRNAPKTGHSKRACNRLQLSRVEPLADVGVARWLVTTRGPSRTTDIEQLDDVTPYWPKAVLSGKGRLKPEDGHLLGELTPSIARLPEHSAGKVHGADARMAPAFCGPPKPPAISAQQVHYGAVNLTVGRDHVVENRIVICIGNFLEAQGWACGLARDDVIPGLTLHFGQFASADEQVGA